MESEAYHLSRVLIELGLVVIGLATLARLASRWGFSAIPLYLLGGLAFGKGGLAPLNLSADFTHLGGEIGVLLLLFMLGLEYTGHELMENLRSSLPAALMDFVLNFTPGVAAGLVLQWKPIAAVLLGGVTYVSSSGIIAKVIGELSQFNNLVTSALLSVLVLEDLAMAVYLPLVGALLAGGGPAKMAVSVSVALAAVLLVLIVAVRFGPFLSHAVAHESDEILILTVFGAVLLVAGLAQRLQVSSAIGAFLVGIAVSGSVAERSRLLLSPLRDLFSATFFFFFGLQIDPASLPSAIVPAVILGVVTALTKILTGFLATRHRGLTTRQRLSGGVALVARGEFSIVIAGLGVAIEPRLGPLSAAYVLLLAVLGPILVRVVL